MPPQSSYDQPAVPTRRKLSAMGARSRGLLLLQCGGEVEAIRVRGEPELAHPGALLIDLKAEHPDPVLPTLADRHAERRLERRSLREDGHRVLEDARLLTGRRDRFDADGDLARRLDGRQVDRSLDAQLRIDALLDREPF